MEKNKSRNFSDNSVRSSISASEIDKKLIMAVSTGNIAFNFLNNSQFKEFCSLLNPEYQVISPDRLKRKLNESAAFYESMMSDKLKKLDKCFITMDGWHSKYESVGIYALFVYAVNENFKREKFFLGVRSLTGSATANAVGDLITDILSTYNLSLNNVIGGVCDAGSNLTAFLDRNLLYHLRCLAHSVALIVKSATEIPSVAAVMRKVNNLASRISRSKPERQIFSERSKKLHIRGRLPLPFSVTRWGGSVMLAESFLAHYECIPSLNRFQEFLLSEAEKKVLNDYVRLLSPYMDAITTSEMDGNFCSEIIPKYSHLYAFISEQNQHKSIVQVLKKQTEERYKEILKNDVALLAVYLDPRSAYLDEILMDKEWKDIEKLAEEYCESYRYITPASSTATPPPAKMPKTSSSSFKNYMASKRSSAPIESVKSEIIKYASDLVTGRPAIDSCPLHFWDANKQRFPKLCLVARHILSSPQSSAEVERLFSKCGSIISSSRRNRLTSQTLNSLLLNAALANIEKMKDVEFQDDACEEKQDENNSDMDLFMWKARKPVKRARSSPPAFTSNF